MTLSKAVCLRVFLPFLRPRHHLRRELHEIWQIKVERAIDRGRLFATTLHSGPLEVGLIDDLHAEKLGNILDSRT